MLWKSVPKESTLHGIKIKKQNNRKFYELIGKLEDLPETFLKDLFPGMSSDEIINKFTKFNTDDFMAIIPRLFQVLPKRILEAIAELLDTDVDYLLDEIGPVELAEIIKEFWKANRLGEFLVMMRLSLRTLKETWMKKIEKNVKK